MEEDETSGAAFDQYFNFEDASLDIQPLDAFDDSFVVSPTFDDSPLFDEAFMPHGEVITETSPVAGGFPYPQCAAEISADASQNDFSRWLPRFKKPEVPCDYCASRHLECFFTYATATACSACHSLFRPCSFVAQGIKRQTVGYIDTLHPVDEDHETRGNLTATRPLYSTGASYNDVVEGLLEHCPEGKSSSSSRFSRATIFILKKWLEAHVTHPYPTDEEKEVLGKQTGLNRNQISNWLANARRRGKVRPRRCVSPKIISRSLPMDIPSSSSSSSLENNLADMPPLERWKASPPEHEPASMTDIARAMATTQYATEHSGPSSQAHSAAQRSSDGNSIWSKYRAPSTTSLETPQSEESHGSYHSALSHGSRSSFNSLTSKDRRRRRLTLHKQSRQETSKNATKKPFQCTFCTDTFGTKYDWVRHENSYHLALEKWICHPLGPRTTLPDGSTVCVYCDAPNPDDAHLETHNHNECADKPRAHHTFQRKDHLRQHLRAVHDIHKLTPTMEKTWKSSLQNIRSRCGFCTSQEVIFTKWGDRTAHLSKHFHEGARMKDWKGDWGFDAEVAAAVTNAVPPFLLGWEATTPRPFSATTQEFVAECLPASEFMGVHRPGLISTCWEVLTLALGEFVRQQRALGVQVTDAMLQRHGRIVVYGCDDEWNQTAADNDEWLALFKAGHALMLNDHSQPDPTDQEWLEFFKDGGAVPMFPGSGKYISSAANASAEQGLGAGLTSKNLENIESDANGVQLIPEHEGIFDFDLEMDELGGGVDAFNMDLS